MGNVVLGNSLIIIKWDWGKFFPKIGKRLTLTIECKKVTYSNSSLNLWIERKYAIELIPVKSYKKCLIFLAAKTLNNTTNHSLKLAKTFSQ